MNTYDLTLTIRKNGKDVPGFAPLVKRITCDEEQPFDYEKADGGGYVALPTTQLDEIQLLLLLVDQAVTLRLNGQSDAGLDLNAGGLVLIINGDLDSAAATNVTVNNSSGSTALVKGLAAGT